jgi:hypothetical protein
MGPFVGMMIFSMIMGCLALWVYAVIDIVRGGFKSEGDKIVWLVLVLLVPALGTVLYYLIGQKQKTDSNDLV